jgi:transposase-like protein
MRNGKYCRASALSLSCRKTWQLTFTYAASQPGTHQKIIDMAMVASVAVPLRLWALASTPFCAI